ncbi:MAG: nicotinate phosphoribosyltransferase, partial [Longimicrobiales bacterium]
VIRLADELGPDFSVRALRLDSGDLVLLSKEARRLLDAAGLQQVQLFASGGLDEFEIRRMLAAGAPLDGFGVGSRMAVSEDAPALDIAYKLTAYAGKDRVKLSPEKQTLPGQKQVFRFERNGRADYDVIGRFDERLPGTPLLGKVMAGGERSSSPKSLPELQERARQRIERLPVHIRGLDPAGTPYLVKLSAGLETSIRDARARVGE